MTTEPNRQPEGIPTGGQFAAKIKSDDVPTLGLEVPAPKTIGGVLGDRYLAAKKQVEAHDQNAWVKDIHEKYPEAAYGHVNVENSGDGRFTAGMDLYAADGSPLELAEDDEIAFETDFDSFWDMSLHEDQGTDALFGSRAKVFSLKSIQDSWAEVESSAEPAVDPFAHLTGMAKAKAQGDYARELSSQAATAYVDHLTSEILTAEPNAARLNLSRQVDVEFGHHFTLESVINADGEALDVDLAALQDESFHDIFLDPHTDYDESDGQIYIDLIPAS